MLFKLKNPEQAKTIAKKWKAQNAPCYVVPSTKKGCVCVYPIHNADPFDVLIFILNHLDMPESEKKKRIRSILAMALVEAQNNYAKFVRENY